MNASGISIFFRDKPKKRIGDIFLDVAILEDYSFESEVSQFPVETGATISDFIRNKPDRITIQGFVTNSPISFFLSRINDLVRGDVDNSVELTFEQLEALHRAREPVTIVAGLKTFESMAIERITIPRNKDTGDAISFNVEAVHIEKANSILVKLPEIKEDTKSLGASKVDKGAQTAKEADTNTTERTSLLKRGADGVLGVSRKIIGSLTGSG